MVGSVLDKVTGYLDKRFVLTALLPSVAFWSAVLGLIVSVQGWSSMLGWWKALPGEGRTLLAIGAVAWLVFFASLLANQTGAITRLYEGYWGDRLVAGWLKRVGTGIQRRRFRKLKDTDNREYEARYRFFPRKEADLLATRFGNTLKGAETYPGDKDRYEMDAVFFWPRLYPLLPDSVKDAFASARSSMELVLVTSLLGYLFAIVAVITLGTSGTTDWRLWAGEVGGGLFVGRLAYRSSVSAAAVYAEMFRSCFDVYRRDLLKQMGWRLPRTLEAERMLWRNLAQQLYRRAADDPTALVFMTPEDGAAKTIGENDRGQDVGWLHDLVTLIQPRRRQ